MSSRPSCAAASRTHLSQSSLFRTSPCTARRANYQTRVCVQACYHRNVSGAFKRMAKEEQALRGHERSARAPLAKIGMALPRYGFLRLSQQGTWTPMALMPSSLSAATASSSTCCLRPVMATAAPCRPARCRACSAACRRDRGGDHRRSRGHPPSCRVISKPIPEPPPVMSATCGDKRMSRLGGIVKQTGARLLTVHRAQCEHLSREDIRTEG